MLTRSKRTVLVLLALGSVGFARQDCGTALAAEYRQSDVDRAVKQLDSADQSARTSAAYHLSEMGPAAKYAVPRLIELLNSDPSMGVRGESANALSKIGPDAEAAVPSLIAFLNNKDGGYERTYAASALGWIGRYPEQAVPALINAIQHDEEPVVRQLAARSIGEFGANARPAIPVLIEAIKDGDKDMREAAAYGLRTIPATASDVPALTALMGDDINSAREAAAKSIGGAGSEAIGAIPTLQKLLKDQDDSVREAATASLRAIDPNAKPTP
jgi:HEAT repeat protein